MSEENFEQLYEQLTELTKEQQRDFLTRNYSRVIKLSRESDPYFQELGGIRNVFVV